jgi:hypothetical protein
MKHKHQWWISPATKTSLGVFQTLYRCETCDHARLQIDRRQPDGSYKRTIQTLN